MQTETTSKTYPQLLFMISSCLLFACDPAPSSSAPESIMLTTGDMSPMLNDLGVEMEADVGGSSTVDSGGPLEDMSPEPVIAHGRVLAGVATRGHADGVAAETRFDGVTCVAQSERWLWMSDTFNGTLRRVDLETGDTHTVGGQPYEFAVVDGSAATARFESPRGCALTDVHHPLGAAFWVSDGPTLRKVTLSDDLSTSLEVITVLGRSGERGDLDGVGAEARLGYLTHHILPHPELPVLYLADRSNDSLREVQMNDAGEAMVRTVARGLNGPGGLAWSNEGLLIANTFEGEIALFTLSDEVLEPIINGLGAPQGICAHETRAWVAGLEGTITEVDLRTGQTSILAGFLGDARALDGSRSKGRLGGAFASIICDLPRQRILYMDNDSNALRAISMEQGSISTVVGVSNPTIKRDGENEDARFHIITDVVGAIVGEPPPGQLPVAKWFVADPIHNAVRVIDEQRGLTTSLFGGTFSESSPLNGPLDDATVDSPIGLAYDEQTNSLYLSDLSAHIISRVDLNAGEVLTIAGQAYTPGSQDGSPQVSSFNEPLGLSFDAEGYLYVVDGSRGVIRSISLSTGDVKTLSEPLLGLYDVELGEDGWLYATNEAEATLVKLTPSVSDLRRSDELGRWEVVAGESGVTGPADGPRGLFAYPLGLTRGPNATLLISDYENHRVRSYSLNDGSLDTFVGSPSLRGSVTGTAQVPWEDLTLYSPYASAWLGNGRGAIVYEGVLMGLWNPSHAPVIEPTPAPPPMLSDLPSGDFEVELRGGEAGDQSLQGDEVITLHRGCQGAQHVWIGLKVAPSDQEPSSLRLSLIDSEAELASLYLEGEYWSVTEDDGFELMGLTFVLYNPSEIIDRELVLGAEVVLPSGQVGYGWRSVTVTWGEDACGR